MSEATVRRAAALFAGVLVLGSACSAPSRPAPQPRSQPPASSAPAPVPPVPSPADAEPVSPLPVLVPPENEPEAPAPLGLPAPAAAPALSLPATVRIGLASDLPRLTLPCCEGELSWPGPAGENRPIAWSRLAGIAVEPLVGGGAAVYRLQVAALKDAERATSMAADLAKKTGLPAEAHFDAGDGLYRVRVGRFGSREAAEAGRSRVPWSGGGAAFVVSETAKLVEPGLQVLLDGKPRLLPGRSLALTVEGGVLRWNGRRYRHRLLVYLNDRGSLNLVNELPFEAYLRGVVPKEMGPEQFNRLEALKAQAVAARTYTLAHLGQFAAEGFDLCSTPSCQVYGGFDAEHPVSDRAVVETEGEVLLYHGAAVEALYTATCGGHTEDVEVVFPGKKAPYLAGLPCIEAGATPLPSGLASGVVLASGLMRRLLPVSARSGPAAFAGRAERLAALAGLEVPRERLASFERREIARYLISLFDLVLDPTLFSGAAGDAAGQSLPREWNAADRANARYLLRAGVMSEPFDRMVADAELETLLFRLALRLGVLEHFEARFSHLEKGALWVTREDRSQRLAISGQLLGFRGHGEAATAAPMALSPGDPLELYLSQGKVLALVAREPGRASPGLGRAAGWTRFKSRSELARQVEQRYPGLGFEGFEVVSRGRSGRVGKLRLFGRGGRSQEVEGLAVRWLLDIPETWFSAREVQPAKGPAGWQFSGKGWGHGVGLCQTGAFGMAQRGLTYREILLHYYSGAELEHLPAGGAS